MRLQGKTALITGASRNIGRQVALTFAREGADLVLNTRQSRQELEEVAAHCRELGVNTHLAMGDVSDPDTAAGVVEEGIGALGKVDILVSNVAIRPHKPILEISNEEWQQVMEINLFPAFYLIKAVLPGMMERRSGSIIAMGGQSAITGRPDTAHGNHGQDRPSRSDSRGSRGDGALQHTGQHGEPRLYGHKPRPTRSGIPNSRTWPAVQKRTSPAFPCAGRVRCMTSRKLAFSLLPTNPAILPGTG